MGEFEKGRLARGLEKKLTCAVVVKKGIKTGAIDENCVGIEDPKPPRVGTIAGLSHASRFEVGVVETGHDGKWNGGVGIGLIIPVATICR